MAIDFNGTTSKLESTTATFGLVDSWSVVAWVFSDGQGESGGYVITIPEETGIWILRHHTAANTMQVFMDFSGTNGQWTFPATDAQWNSIAFSYNGSSVSNIPVALVNSASVTVSTLVAPTGTVLAPATAGYCVGNKDLQDRSFDGMIEHLQVFDRIITAQEMDACSVSPGCITSGLRLWLPMKNAADVSDASGNGFNGTGTALADRAPGAPLMYPPYPSRVYISAR